jgi:3-dehydroquinate dehydratase-2
MKKVWLLNGPNLNRLGKREAEHYGTLTLEEIIQKTEQHAADLGLSLESRQTNHEGELVEWLHECEEEADGLILNAAAFTHSSVAIYDALKMLSIPVVEVHLSNIYAREEFRHHSFVSPVVTGGIFGLGWYGYLLACNALAEHVHSSG